MAAASSPSDLGPGALLGEYRLEEELGEGGMGRVFRARRVDDGAEVAIKVLRPELAVDDEAVRRFAREARAAGAVASRHLVPVLGAGGTGGLRYLVMALVSGGSLARRIQRDGPLGVEAVVEILGQVARGLDALHGQGLVHRDVKSSNVLLGDDGCARLSDFGLVKGSAYSALTRPGQLVGTLDYIAPELIRGEEAAPASDVYALGCVAYECLAGQPPFHGRGMFQLGLAHLDEDPGDPCASRPETPVGLGQAVGFALAKEPSQRPPSATAFANLVGFAARGAQGR